jgi:hypothetical protein
LRTLLLPYLEGATRVVLQDPYVRSQLTRLRELEELIRSVGGHVATFLKTVKWRDEEGWSADKLDPLHGSMWQVAEVAKRRLHARWIKIWRVEQGKRMAISMDMDRGLDMYMRPSNSLERWWDSETLRARETVIGVHISRAEDGGAFGQKQSKSSIGTTNAANRLANMPARKLRRLAQAIRRLVRRRAAGGGLDAAQIAKVRRRSAVELALARTRGPQRGCVEHEMWVCPVPWCREWNFGSRARCFHMSKGCLGIRDGQL